MSRLKVEDILIPGAKLKVNKVDFGSQEIKAQIEELRQAQKECEERKKVNWNRLINTCINI